MLKLIDIYKHYYVGEHTIEALKAVNITFRQNEFIAVLGPSGCGKTTLLNIVGGLDQYTTGDLVIENCSTKIYKARDWDSYRNHSVGFVFQSYNLIPHQTVLGNVELALTLSGVSKAKRRQLAMESLEMVGLHDQIYKKPNQLSGGQMQRVAIARALVNNPQIILADEPTGALDTETSLQIMQILEEISKNRLVIMVTHNPELANRYATRIIKLVDGVIISDTNPYVELVEEKIKKVSIKQTTMSFFTALMLSLNNLITKKARTLMTAFAGSIGIIGIALILSLSSGFNEYVEQIEKDTLSSYPLVIESQTRDYQSMLNRMLNRSHGTTEIEHDLDKIYSNDILKDVLLTLMDEVKINDLKSFKTFLDSNEELKTHISSIKYSYNADINIYQEQNGLLQQLIPFRLGSGVSNPISASNIWQEMLDNPLLLSKQYDVLEGAWPKNFNEVVLVVNENNEISDFSMYALGLKEYSEISEIIKSVYTPGYEYQPKQAVYEYKDVIGMSYNLVVDSQYYQYNEKTGLYTRNSSIESITKVVKNDDVELKIVGVIKAKPNIKTASITGQIGYTKELTKYIVDKNMASEVINAQLDSPYISVINGADITDQQRGDILYNMGWADYSKPASISIYPSSFEAKEQIIKIIEQYNVGKDEEQRIQYTDYVAMMMTSVGQIINSITYILIAFVAISLVVSSIMIGIITYISVLERTKEIGILRSIGASKKDIARVFNAETLIIGFVAGLIGVLLAVLLDIPINIIINAYTGISAVAKVPFFWGVILIVISMILTLIAGLIPSRFASKKDPVIALRSE